MKHFASLAFLFFQLFIFQENSIAQTRYRGVTVDLDINEEDIAVLEEWNVNLVRYPLVYAFADGADEASYFAWLEGQAIPELKEKLELFRAHGIDVLIELYSPPGGFRISGGRSPHRLFLEAWTQSAFLLAWQKIATEFVNEPGVWGYELLNEPAQNSVTSGLLDWNKLALAAANVVRSIDTNAERVIVIEPIRGSPLSLSKLKPIHKSVSGIVYSVHAYYNLKFSHQGLYGNPINISYPTKKFNKKEMDKYFKKISKFQKKTKVPMYIGEFTAVRWAPSGSAYRYLADELEIIEKYGFDWTYHAYREVDSWSVEHSEDPADHERSITPTDREILLRQYLGRNY